MLVLLVLHGASGCTDETPTSGDEGLIPIDVLTVDIRLPFSSFAEELRSFSGFGSASELPEVLIAHQFAGELESRAMLAFGALPDMISVLPPGATTGALPDSSYEAAFGKVVIKLDTVGLAFESGFDLEAEAILTAWHAGTADWEFAVDTLGVSTLWPEPGGGPVRPITSVTWAPAVSDSLIFQIDSTTVQEWAEADRFDRGLRIRGTTEGSRLRVLSADFRVSARSSINPDTLVEVSAEVERATIIYSPSPIGSPDVIRVGGAPAARTTFRMVLPSSVDPGPEACARIDCPLELEADRILFAGLALHTHATLSAGFSPMDSVSVELRPVLNPERLPRSPLDFPVHGALIFLAPELFSSQSENLLQIPMTSYLRGFLEVDSTNKGIESPTFALMAGSEASGLEVLSFYAPGTQLEPYLHLVLSVSDGVPLP